MNDHYWSGYSEYRRPTIDRQALIDLALRLKAELDDLHTRCHQADEAGEDFTELWARSGGMFFAYRQIADLLGWQ